jgi:hypothetical protein
LGLQLGDLVTYDGTLETRVSLRGDSAGLLAGASTGSLDITAEWTGRQRLLVLAAGDHLEVVEDFTAEAGVFTIEEGGDQTVVDPTRDELLDFKPPTPPLVVDRSGRPVDAGRSGAPAARVGRLDPMAVAAVIGPPLSSEAVDVGDTWSDVVDDVLLGAISFTSEVTAEVELDDGTLVFVVEFGATAGDLPVELDIEAALDLIGTVGDRRDLADALSSQAASSVTIRSVVLDGTAQIDPGRGVMTAFESLQSFAVDVEVADGDEVATASVEAGSTRSFTLRDHSRAAPFEIESVLDRFETDPFSLSAAAFEPLAGYELSDASDEVADRAFDALFDIRQDLFAGATIANVADADGESVTAIAITTGGEFRGAPFVAEEVAAFLSGTRPRSVSVGDHAAYRVTVGEDEWLMFNNETHLYVTIGVRALSERVMRDFAESASPYLWQTGDCLDFADEFDSATPYAPFGMHGLRHCAVDHTYEVIHTEVLPEGPGARFPSDLSDRSEATCGRAFFEATGTSELETAVSLIRYLPDRDEWEKGSRYFGCVIYIAGADGEVSVAGRVDGSDPELAFTLEVGTCLFSLFPVDCDDPHNGEIIGVFEFPEGPGVPMPDTGDLQELITEQCTSAFDAFTFGSGPGVVEVFDLSDVFAAWDFGARRYYCMAVSFGDDGFRLDITGTFGAGWEEAAERVAT